MVTSATASAHINGHLHLQRSPKCQGEEHLGRWPLWMADSEQRDLVLCHSQKQDKEHRTRGYTQSGTSLTLEGQVFCKWGFHKTTYARGWPITSESA